MKTIREIYRHKPTLGRVGIEIEVEGDRLPDPSYTGENFNRFWRVERDGSLRGESWEYVLNNPIPLTYVRTALRSLEVAYERCKSNVHDSERAGVHVHINVQELNLIQLANFITAYLILEEPLVKFCGETREGNHFCLRTIDAEYILRRLEDCFIGKDISSLGNQDIRYSSINLNALKRYGSLEFRSMRSTKDFSQIELWIKLLHKLMEGSSTFNNPRQMIESMSNDGWENLVKTLVGEDFFKIITNIDSEKAIMRGIRNIQDFAYIVDWDDYAKESPSKSKEGIKLVLEQAFFPTTAVEEVFGHGHLEDFDEDEEDFDEDELG